MQSYDHTGVRSQSVARAIKKSFQDNKVLISDRGAYYSYFVRFAEIEYWRLDWIIYNTSDRVLNNRMRINLKTEDITDEASKHIADISSEYTVMFKMGMYDGEEKRTTN